MIIPFYEEIDEKYKKINLVNENNEEFKQLGLEPLNIELYPLYIMCNQFHLSFILYNGMIFII